MLMPGPGSECQVGFAKMEQQQGALLYRLRDLRTDYSTLVRVLPRPTGGSMMGYCRYEIR